MSLKGVRKNRAAGRNHVTNIYFLVFIVYILYSKYTVIQTVIFLFLSQWIGDSIGKQNGKAEKMLTLRAFSKGRQP